MASWANLITIGTQPGPGILDAIRMVQAETNTSISALIVAEMSSKGLHTRPLIVNLSGLSKNCRNQMICLHWDLGI